MMPSEPVSAVDPTTREYQFTDRDFQTIANIAHKKYGLHLQPSKKPLVYSRLTKRLRALNLPDFESYCALLSDSRGNEEQSHLLSALTTNVTHFFRERHHFTYLRETILPNLVEKAKTGSPVRLWSSACSAGQEAYSMAAMIRDVCPDASRYDIKLLATDVDPQMIQKARHAQYEREQASAIPDEYKRLMLDNDTGGPHFRMREDLTALVTFGELNLMADWPMRRRFDVIFCRNAAIYFDKDTQFRLWQRFSEILHDGGHLMIGHSERLSGPAENDFHSVAITTYQRHPRQGASIRPPTKD